MSVPDLLTIRQCLSLLPLEDFSAPCLDYGVRKLNSVGLMKVFIIAQLCKWEDLRRIQLEVEADPLLQQEIGCSISASQLSRRIEHFPSCVLEALCHSIILRIRQTAASQKKLPKEPLFIVDSTNLRLPHQLADWTYVTKHRSGVKVHTRLAVLSDGSCFPDKIVPSTGNVSDYEGSDLLVTDANATYLLDRGYVSYRRMDRWLLQECRFVLRINGHHAIKQVLLETATDPSDSLLLRDAIVYLGGSFRWMEHPVRLVEFHDEQGRLYRIATSRFDLSAREIANLYRQRWQIELFFKWMKQHLKFATLYSYKPQAVWNHILLAMTAYCLMFLIRMTAKSPKTTWELLRLLRVYAFRNWEAFQKAMNKPVKRKTKGRQRRKEPPEPLKAKSCHVALVKPSKKQRQL
ncbi:IS4 family transposase [Paenibacillus marchantiophytorum]|uniref:IS4 family transposase n=1 Tax=Paenibacillus marchantiophytorum TaxID=1619310 RepID=UPI00166A0F3D|nr:IS4 family transposase [Paenibacillus marchantiophytorum]